MQHIKQTLFILSFIFLSMRLTGQTDSILHRYERYWEMSPGIYRVLLDGKMGVVHEDGKIIAPCEFSQVWDLNTKGYFKVLKDRKLGLYKTDGTLLIPAEYDQIWPAEDGRIKVLKDGKIGFFNQSGGMLIPAEYQQIWEYKDGKARALKNGQIGYLDQNGYEIIPCIYQQIWEFKEGKARVLINGKLGYINETGQEIIPAQYSQIWEFEEGKAKALYNGEMVWIDSQGNILDLPMEQPVEKEKTDSWETDTHRYSKESSSDTTVIRVWSSHVEIVEDDGHHVSVGFRTKPRKRYNHFKGHYTGASLNFNNYVTSDGSFSLPPEHQFMDLNAAKSVGFTLNFIQHSIQLQQRGNIGLVTGMGIEWSNYRFDSKYILTKNDQGETTYKLSEYPIKKNKLTTCYLNVPLLLEFQIPVGEQRYPLYFSAGAIGGLRLGSHTKVIYNIDGSSSKKKNRNDFNLQTWRYGTTFRLGYRAINLYADYYLSSMFEKDKGPELYPVNVGLLFYIDL